MIQAKDLKKEFSDKVAVDSLSFNIETGKVTGFLGPNGAGKSTTMRLMLGLDNGGGTTTYDDKPLHNYGRPSQVVGILLEAKAFHPTRTARRHLSILATAGNVPKGRVDEVLDIVGLKDVANSKPGKFSLGMSQRLGIAAAILGEPKYLILDEIDSGLDVDALQKIAKTMAVVAKQMNIGVLVITHYNRILKYLKADRVIVMDKGLIVKEGGAKLAEDIEVSGYNND